MATTKSIILVVEDEQESRDSLREILEFEGYQVETAVNGQEALAALNAGAALDIGIVKSFVCPVIPLGG